MAGRGNRLPDATTERILVLCTQGFTQSEIAKAVGCWSSTVRRILVRHGKRPLLREGKRKPRWKPGMCRICSILLDKSICEKHPEPPIGDYCNECREHNPGLPMPNDMEVT